MPEPKQLQISFFNEWFARYHRSFDISDPYIQENFQLKISHSERVCGYMAELGAALELSGEQRALAQIVALFHDIGRFEQFARYRTFNDLRSQSHGWLGAVVLEREGILNSLPESEREIVLLAVRHHGERALPALQDPEQIMFCRLIRDADKIDIIATLAAYYAKEPAGSNPALELDMPADPMCSAAIGADVLAGRVADYSQMQTLTDFKIGQLSWVYDINFDYTLRRIQGFGYPECICARIPRNPFNDRICAAVRDYLTEKQAL